MARFQRTKGKGGGEISTSSLPDIIFILLFFFMVATVLKEVSLKVENKLPVATELQKLEKRSLISYIYIGSPTGPYRSIYGTAPRIQLNDAIKEPGDVGAFIESEKAEMPEDMRSFLKVAIKQDRDTKIGILTDVKQELRKANALKVTYSANPRTEVYQVVSKAACSLLRSNQSVLYYHSARLSLHGRVDVVTVEQIADGVKPHYS